MLLPEGNAGLFGVMAVCASSTVASKPATARQRPSHDLRVVACIRPMWGGKDSLRAAVWEVLKHEPKGLVAEDVARRVADGDFKLAAGGSTSEVQFQCSETARFYSHRSTHTTAKTYVSPGG